MPSCALSKRRGPLRRPHVCETKKNPGRCEEPDPPVPCVCGIKFNPDDLPVFTDEDYQLPWEGCNQNFPPTHMITPLCAAWRGEITDIESAENCTEGNEIAYTAPSTPGYDYIVFRINWPGEPACQQVLYFDVEEEP